MDASSLEARELRRRVMELLDSQMETDGVSRAELARRLHVTPSAITQLLDEYHEPTLRAVAHAAHALGYRVHVQLEPLPKEPR